MLCRVVWVSGTLVCQMWSVHLHHGVQSMYAQHTHCACTWLYCCEATLSQHSQTLSVMCSYRAYSYVCLINTVGQARVSSLRLCKSDLHWANVQFVTGHQCEQHGKPCPPSPSFFSLYYRKLCAGQGKRLQCSHLACFAVVCTTLRVRLGTFIQYSKSKIKFCKPRSITSTTSKCFLRHFWNTVV